MSISSSSLITQTPTLDDTRPSSVEAEQDRTGRGDQTARPPATGSSPLRGSSPDAGVSANRNPGRPTYFDAHRPALFGADGHAARLGPPHWLLLLLAVCSGRPPERLREVVHGLVGRAHRLSSQRPGSRVLISWSSHPLPSGSLNAANEP